MRRAVKGILGCVVLGLALPGCLFFLDKNPVETYRSARRLGQFDEVDPTLPHITLVMHAFGEDAIDVYTPGSEEEQIALAEAAAADLVGQFAVAAPNFFEDNIASVDLGRRLLTRDGELFTLTVRSDKLLATIEGHGYPGFDLLFCPPNAEAVFAASRLPDFETCFNGRAWEVRDEGLTVTVTVRPRTVHYLAFVAAVVLALVLFGALAWYVGNRLREGPFRNRTSASVALGLIVGVLAGVGLAWPVASGALQLGPSDNLALAKDLSLGPYVLSAAIPALASTVPGWIFMILLVKRRPWPEQPAREQHPWPAPPPPPGPPGAPPPPPIAWGGR